MNANLTIIDSIQPTQAQSARNASARGSGKAQDDRGWSRVISKSSHDSTVASNETPRTEYNSSKPEVSQSDNLGPEKTAGEKKTKNSSFKKVLNRQLKQTQAKQGAENVESQSQQQTQPNEAVPKQNDGQVSSSAEIKNTDVSSENQTVVDTQNVQTSQVALNLAAQIVTDSVTVAKNSEINQNAQLNIMPQSSMSVVDVPKDEKNTQQVGQQSADATSLIKFQQTQTQSLKEIKSENSQESVVAAKQTGVINAVKADLPVVSDKDTSGNVPASSKPENPQNTNQLNQSNQIEQPVLTQSNNQSTDLNIAEVQVVNNTSVIPAINAAGGKQPGKETTRQDNAKSKSAGNFQSDVSQLSADRSNTEKSLNELTAGFEKVQVEVTPSKNNETQQQSSSSAAQPATLQPATAVLDQLTNDRPVVTNRVSAQVNNTSAQDAAASVREQISTSVQNAVQQGSRQLTIHLNPPELGRVSIKFTEKAGELSGTLETTNSQTRSEIQQALPEIIRSLEQSGITVKRIDVSLSDLSRQPNQDFSRDNNAQSYWQQLAQNGFNDGSGNRFSQNTYVNSSQTSNISGFTAAGTDTNPNSPSTNLLDVLI
jgi:hypothetical protein